MMSAADAATRTINAIREQVKKINIDNLIAEAADNRKTEIALSLSQISEMFGLFAEDDINVLARHPVAFRLFRAEMVRLRYECRFQQLSDGWYFVISWKESISI
jgi:hypothetical protein